VYKLVIVNQREDDTNTYLYNNYVLRAHHTCTGMMHIH